MKHILSMLACIVSISQPVFAQHQDTFDIATFQPPAGWKKQAKEGVVIFTDSDQQKGSYAIISLYRSGKSTGDASGDFAADWQDIAVGQMAVKSKPEIEPDRQAEGWSMISGGAAHENELGKAAVILTTFSGHGTRFCVAAVFNNASELPAIEALLSSIKLKLPEPAAPAAVQSDNGDRLVSSIVGTWVMGSSGTVRADDYKTPYSVNGYGYSKYQYSLNSDGTYSFYAKTFRMVVDKILLVRESGTYQIAGDSITISPQKSVIEAWSKRDGTDKWGTRLTTQNRRLEKVTYRFKKHYFSGIQIWNLVLQADTATERDGPFSTNTTFTNAWYYAPISANNTAIDLPR